MLKSIEVPTGKRLLSTGQYRLFHTMTQVGNHARYRGQIGGTGGVVSGTAASFGDTVKLQRIGELC